MNEQALEYIRNIRLIDDSFFEVFFKGDPKYIEVVIHEIFLHWNLLDFYQGMSQLLDRKSTRLNSSH